MTFRAFDNTPLNTEAFLQRLQAQAPFQFIHAPGNQKKIKAVRDRWPEKVITLQDAYGGINQHYFAEVWPGHLLYKQGSLLAQNIEVADDKINVSHPERIAKDTQSVEKTNQTFPFTLTLYALDTAGKPDWSKAEHVILQSIKGSTLTVKRGQWGSQPLTFKAGKAVVAAHMMFWTRQWQLNFSLHCPRGGPQNLTAAEWFAKKMATKVNDAHANGIEFDVARWTWSAAEKNPMDINNDLVADYGYIDGVNSFGLGGQVFFRELRRLLGPDKIIQADSNDAQTGIRGWQYINGVQLESFPTANDFSRFSQAFTHLRLWVDNAQTTPAFSYPFTKTPTTLFAGDHLPNGGNTDFRFRIGLAAACLTGMPHPFASLKDIGFDPANVKSAQDHKRKNNKGHHNESFGVFAWDEYHGGDLNNGQWLGRPLETAQQDLSNIGKTNLLAKSGWQWSVAKGFNTENSLKKENYVAQIKQIPSNSLPEDLIFGVHLAPKDPLRPLVAGEEYTLEFDAQGDDHWQTTGQSFTHVPRMIAISGAIGTGARHHPLSVLVDATPRHYRLSFIADGSAPAQFGVSEQIGRTQISNIKLYQGSAERWSRAFENGRVLLNMTQRPWITTLKNNYYRHLKGSQNPNTNNGQVIGEQITVPPQDAVFLVKR